MMMTKHLRIILALILLLAVSAAKASTLYYVVDNIRYAVNTDDKTAEVASYAGYKNMTEINISVSITVEGVAYCVTELGDSCFYDCTSLESVTIPNSVTELGSSCFSGCTSLTSVTIPNSVTELRGSCFEDCTSMTSITIPNSVTSLGFGCFYGCTSLTSITIPNSVTSFDNFCFYSCTSLKEVTCLADTPPRVFYSFEDEEQKTLYVPEASVDAYKSSSYEWKDFGKILPVSASGIKAVSKDDIGMSVENGTLTLSNVPENEPVSVYSTTGQLLGTGKGNISVDAQTGQMIIVKVGGKSYKVLVK